MKVLEFLTPTSIFFPEFALAKLFYTSHSQTFWSRDLFTSLKIISDPKAIFLSHVTVFNILEIKTEKLSEHKNCKHTSY